MKKKCLTAALLATIFFVPPTWAGEKDPFDGLGKNRDIYEQVNGKSESSVQIVQRRYNDRTSNFEFSLGTGFNMTGQNYFDSQSLQGSIDYHFNPRWSISLRGKRFSNNLDGEGIQVFNSAESSLKEKEGASAVSRFIPELNWKKSQAELLGRWYPFYGKLSLVNSSIMHFDLYSQLGVSSIQFRSNNEIGYLAGLGIASWLGSHFTARIELNLESFTQRYETVTKTSNPTEISFSVGYLL